MPSCFTCGQDITFNKKYLSKTGKQIPLWPDEKNTHGHDESGRPIRGDLPPTQQTQNFYTPPPPPTESFKQTTQSQGGSYLDTKRIRVMLEDLTKKSMEHDEIFQASYELARNQSNMLTMIMDKLGISPTMTAADLYKKQSEPQQEEEEKKIHGWDMHAPPEGVSDDL